MASICVRATTQYSTHMVTFTALGRSRATMMVSSTFTDQGSVCSGVSIAYYNKASGGTIGAFNIVYHDFNFKMTNVLSVGSYSGCCRLCFTRLTSSYSYPPTNLPETLLPPNFVGNTSLVAQSTPRFASRSACRCGCGGRTEAAALASVEGPRPGNAKQHS